MCRNCDDLGHYIKQISDKLQAAMDASLKNEQLTFSQMHVLGFIFMQGGQATQKDIERFMKVSHPTVVGLVSRLTINGYLEHHMDSKDHRNKIVVMTEKAFHFGDILDQHKEMMETKLTNGMSEEEVLQLKHLLKKVNDNIK